MKKTTRKPGPGPKKAEPAAKARATRAARASGAAREDRAAGSSGPSRASRASRDERATPASPRARIVSIMDEIGSIEARVATLAVAVRADLERAATTGAVVAGGFATVEELLASQLGDASPLAMLKAEPWPSCAHGGSFAAYAKLLDAIDAREGEAKQLVKRARTRLGTLERGGYRAGGYRSYEELLERVVVGFPHLAGALMVTELGELAEQRERDEPFVAPGPSMSVSMPQARPMARASASASASAAASAAAALAGVRAWSRGRVRTWGIAAAASLLVLVASAVALRARAGVPSRSASSAESAAP